MNWVSIIWSVGAGASMTLAVVHLLAWLPKRDNLANLFFSLMAAGTAAMGLIELAALKAETTASFGEAVRWFHLPVWIVILSMVGFVRVHLRAGRRWLAWSICVIRTLSLALNFVLAPNLNFKSITALHRIPLFGESVALIQGVPNPWQAIAQASLFLLIVYLIDATIQVWRRGNRRLALTVGLSFIFVIALATAETILVVWAGIAMPFTLSLFFMIVSGAMGFELSRSMLRSAELAREIHEKEVELIHLQRIASLNEISTTIAHEINQPLAIILTNAQAARRLLAREPPDVEGVSDILADIVSEDQRAGEVITRMRNFVKRGEPDLHELQFDEVVREALMLARTELVNREISVSLDLAESLPAIAGDFVALEQVVFNLVRNASEAMSENPPYDRTLVISSRQQVTKVVLSIADNGCGLPADRNRCFDPFFTTKPGGLGMGLAISRTIVEGHGGRLRAEPNSPRGAVFHVELPAVETLSPIEGQSARLPRRT